MKDLKTYITEAKMSKKAFIMGLFQGMGYTVSDAKMSSFTVTRDGGKTTRIFKIKFEDTSSGSNITMVEQTKYPSKEGFSGWEGQWLQDEVRKIDRGFKSLGIKDYDDWKVCNVKASKKNYKITWTLILANSACLWK